jgi:hypothetical protein
VTGFKVSNGRFREIRHVAQQCRGLSFFEGCDGWMRRLVLSGFRKTQARLADFVLFDWVGGTGKR